MCYHTCKCQAKSNTIMWAHNQGIVSYGIGAGKRSRNSTVHSSGDMCISSSFKVTFKPLPSALHPSCIHHHSDTSHTLNMHNQFVSSQALCPDKPPYIFSYSTGCRKVQTFTGCDDPILSPPSPAGFVMFSVDHPEAPQPEKVCDHETITLLHLQW